MKVDILAIGVHPDDVELSCSGTILKHIQNGYKVGLLDLTQGELGTRGTAEIRLKEAEAAKLDMGALFRENLKMKDGFFKPGETNLLKLIEVVRWCKPEIVLANALKDRHPDHGRAAEFIKQGLFLGGLQKIKTQRDGVDQEAHRPRKVFHYIQDYNLNPDIVIDISDFMDRKIELMMNFKSQFFDPNSEEKQTPISSKGFLDFIKAKGLTYGRHIGAKYGEGFNVDGYLGADNLFDLK